MFTTQHHNKIAACISPIMQQYRNLDDPVAQAILTDLCYYLSEMLEADNPTFNVPKFIQSCGATP